VCVRTDLGDFVQTARHRSSCLQLRATRIAAIGAALRANGNAAMRSEYAARRIEHAIGIEVECGGIRQDALDMRFIDCRDFKLAIPKTAAATGACAHWISEPGPREIRNERRVVESDDSEFLQRDRNANTDAVMVSARLGVKWIGTDFGCVADGNVERIAVGTSAARRSDGCSCGIGWALQLAVEHGLRIGTAGICACRTRAAIAIAAISTAS
jgi:hypothetical protein